MHDWSREELGSRVLTRCLYLDKEEESPCRSYPNDIKTALTHVLHFKSKE